MFSMKKIDTLDSIGHVICHDITRIIKDSVKDTPFRKGHIVVKEDIPILLSLGKEHLYVWENGENMLHEDEAAEILASVCINKNIEKTSPREGKIELIAQEDGLFRIDVDRLEEINELEEIIISTRHTNYPVKKGDKLAATRVIPLVIEKEKLKRVQEIADNRPLLELLPYKCLTVGIVTTGSEVFKGRIKDTFTPVIREKLGAYKLTVCGHITVGDELEEIISAISGLKEMGAELIICTGGMSVDPDDLTPTAIKASGAKIVTYGAPVLPGAMFLMGYFEDETPIVGLPGCVMYSKTTIFDLVLPRILAGIHLSKKDLAKMGHGGLCLNCEVCRYPDCGFGKNA